MSEDDEFEDDDYEPEEFTFWYKCQYVTVTIETKGLTAEVMASGLSRMNDPDLRASMARSGYLTVERLIEMIETDPECADAAREGLDQHGLLGLLELD